MKPKLKPPRSKRLKLRCVVPLLNFAFKLDLRRYNKGMFTAAMHYFSLDRRPPCAVDFTSAPPPGSLSSNLVGRCRLNL
jgi:hypothetical protein